MAEEFNKLLEKYVTLSQVDVWCTSTLLCLVNVGSLVRSLAQTKFQNPTQTQVPPQQAVTSQPQAVQLESMLLEPYSSFNQFSSGCLQVSIPVYCHSLTPALKHIQARQQRLESLSTGIQQLYPPRVDTDATPFVKTLADLGGLEQTFDAAGGSGTPCTLFVLADCF